MRSMLLAVSAAVMLAAVAGCPSEGSVQGAARDDAGGPQDASALIDGNTAFALDLYRSVAEEDPGANVFMSPFSISSALAMTYTGAAGGTAREMEEVLRFTRGPEATGRAFMDLMAAISPGDPEGAGRGEPFTLSAANGLWVQDGFALLDGYVENVTGYYDAAVRNLDFEGAPEASRTVINDWAAEKTMDRIRDLIPPGLIDDQTRLVLTNAVYFKASWSSPFDENATTDGRFLLADGSATEVPMMRQTEHFRYASVEGCAAVEMPYEGGGAVMLILLPDGDIGDFEKGLDSERLRSVRDRMISTNVALSLPKFEFTETLELGRLLIAMGMETAFHPGADFSGMTGGPDLYITEVVHKAFVKVDEAGTEAAAATAVVMAITAMPEQPVEMNVNRPFIFFIMDGQTDSIIFMGKVMDPSG